MKSAAAPTALFAGNDPRPVHFMGIGGAGMSALAELFLRRGIPVTGCDANPAGAADLIALGVRVHAGHDAAHVADTRALVYSSAISLDHPELLGARAHGIPVIRRAEALAEAVSGGRLVGIAGTHGKSTTTVMTTEALVAAGLDPTAVVGARMSSWNGNLRRGGGEIFVVEADEYDRSFLALDPHVAVVTNVEADHLDIYRDLEDVRAAFTQYIARARHVVLCADDEGANTLKTSPSSEVVRYSLERGPSRGLATDARLVARDVRAEGRGSAFSVWFDDAHAGDALVQVPGDHNVRNALAALASGLLLGQTVDSMAPGLAAFGGVERRFQRLGETQGITIVDDYAHHPTEIRATLSAARAAFPNRRLVVAFQPHLFTRTRDFSNEFGQALSGADVVLLTAIYAAREDPLDGVTSDLIAAAILRAGGVVAWQGERPDAADALNGILRHGDVLLTVGAGDITRTGPEVLVRLEQR